MGGAASITSSDSSSPDVHLVDFTDREQFLRDCSVFFDTMQSSDGTAAKHRIYSVLNGLHQASEILNVFLLYCPQGRMDCSRFVDLCRDIKLLEKAFTTENARTVFVSGRANYYGVVEEAPEDVNFAGFLYHIVPELAFAKHMEEDILADRLARHHMPSPLVEKTISFKRSMSSNLCSPQVSPLKKPSSSNSFKTGGSESKEGDLEEAKMQEKEQHVKVEDLEEGVASSSGLDVPVAQSIRDVVQEANTGLEMDLPLKNQAATKIQSKFRCRIAKRKALNLKQLKKGKRIKDAVINSKLKAKLEKELKKVFQFYCPNDDIDREGFLWLLKDGGLLGHKYLSVDADYNFLETIAKVELAETPRKYSPGVRYHKRFTFLVFKDIALSFVALSTGMTYDNVVTAILKNSSPS